MIRIPYQLIESLFGTWIADNFNNISTILLIIGFMIWLIRILLRKRSKKTLKRKGQFKQPKWYPTGWYWDEKKQSWIPPDYLNKEANERWEWDGEKQVWIDKNKVK